MRSRPAVLEVLLLSVHPEQCGTPLHRFRDRGATVRMASAPRCALELLRRRPNLVFVDLVHGPGLDARVVEALNRPPRLSRVVVLHGGRLDAHLDQVERLAVDGFCRLARAGGRASRAAGGARP